MKLIHVRVDDDLANLLEHAPNKSEIVRQALRLYLEGIQTGTVEGMRAAFKLLTKQIEEMDSKVDYIAAKVQEVRNAL